jgi:phage/plasmid-like protein (TIGR03299 family)
MPANVQTMAYYGDVPWHGLGTRIEKGLHASEMIQAAGLDWEVDLRPARGARKINRKGEFSRYEVVRMPRKGYSEDEVLLGVVSRRYQPLQNQEAFEFFDPLVEDGTSYFETAGALGEGERIWVMAKMPGAMEIVKGDECFRYLLLSNTHSGEGSVIVKFTSVRVVCQNTLTLAMEDGQKAYRIRHSKQMQFKLKELSEFMAITKQVYQEAEASFRRLAKVQLTEEKLRHYMEAVFPKTKAQKKKPEEPQRWTEVRKTFDGLPDLQLPGVQGTLWAAYNAITRMEDYKQPNKTEMPEQRLQRTWFGSGAETKLLALLKAQELSKQWLN